MAQHNELGKKGEDLAVAHLEKNGYEILTRNYVYLKGEIDIIACHSSTIIIVEVKTRTTPEWGDPQDFLKKSQINRLVVTANHYIEHYADEDVEVRFDIIAIVSNKAGTKIEHLENAFYHF